LVLQKPGPGSESRVKVESECKSVRIKSKNECCGGEKKKKDNTPESLTAEKKKMEAVWKKEKRRNLVREMTQNENTPKTRIGWGTEAGKSSLSKGSKTLGKKTTNGNEHLCVVEQTELRRAGCVTRKKNKKKNENVMVKRKKGVGEKVGEIEKRKKR